MTSGSGCSYIPYEYGHFTAYPKYWRLSIRRRYGKYASGGSTTDARYCIQVTESRRERQLRSTPDCPCSIYDGQYTDWTVLSDTWNTKAWLDREVFPSSCAAGNCRLVRLPITSYYPSNSSIGAIGLSVSLLGLELTLLTNATSLTWTSFPRVLFQRDHIPLLLVSVLPAAVLSIFQRSDWMNRKTCGAPRHTLFVPGVVMAVSALYWIIIASTGRADSEGLKDLAAKG